MANLQTVILSSAVPQQVTTLPVVTWYGDNPIIKLPKHDMRSHFGKTLIYTKSVRTVIDALLTSGISLEELYWQDLDAYGSTKIFKA